MNALLEELREKPFNEVKGVKVIKVEDYLLQKLLQTKEQVH